MKKLIIHIIALVILILSLNCLVVSASHLSYGVEALGLDKYNRYLSTKDYASEVVTVAVVDSGVANIDFLSGKLIAGCDFIDVGNDGMCDTSLDSHGTAIASIVADSIKLLPIRIMPIRILEDKNVLIDNLVDGIRYAVDNGADVINLSIGGTVSDCSEIDEALAYAYENDVVVVTSAGNERIRIIDYCPAHNNSAITVSAVNSNNVFAKSFSNFGETVDCCAPGVGISVMSADGNINTVNGTSFSAGFITAGVAMIRLEHPEYTVDEIQETVKKITVDLGKEGFDYYYGYGLPKFDKLIDVSVSIKNYDKYHKKYIGYKSTVVFRADVVNLPENFEIEWFVNGSCVGYGNSYTLQNVREDFDVYVQITSAGEVLAKSETEVIYINDGLLYKIVALIQSLFGILPIIQQ